MEGTQAGAQGKQRVLEGVRVPHVRMPRGFRKRRGERKTAVKRGEREGRRGGQGGGSWTQNTMSLLGSRYSLSLWTWALPTSPHDTPQPPRP